MLCRSGKAESLRRAKHVSLPPGLIIRGIGLSALFACVVLESRSAALAAETPAPSGIAQEAARPSAAPIALDGKTLARIHCAVCHLYPEPNVLDKKTWREQTLGRMKIRMGLAPDDLDKNSEADLIKATGVIPTPPTVSEEMFRLIASY